jgi:hypothetical protein
MQHRLFTILLGILGTAVVVDASESTQLYRLTSPILATRSWTDRGANGAATVFYRVRQW